MAIYAIHILDLKFVKIGFTAESSPERRIAELQVASPFKLLPLVFVNGTLRQEQSLHASLTTAFGRIRVPVPPNEWYPGRHPFMRGFLENLKTSVGQALAFSDSYDPAVKQPGQMKGGQYSPIGKWCGSKRAVN